MHRIKTMELYILCHQENLICLFSVQRTHDDIPLNLFLQLRVGSPLQSWNSAALELLMRFWHGGVNYLRLCQGMQHAIYHLWCNNACLHNRTKRMWENNGSFFFYFV